MPNKIERFTPPARRVLALAQETAERLQHNTIGAEHLLIALIREENGVAARVLLDLGLDQRRAEELVVRMTKAKPRELSVPLKLADDIENALALAVEEAQQLGNHSIGTEHLLLGLLRLDDSVAVNILKRLDISPEKVRSKTLEELQDPPSYDPALSAPFSAAMPNVSVMSGMSQAPHGNRMERFTNRARRVLSLAQEEAERLQHTHIGTEHLLIGLIREEGSVAARVLRDLNLDQHVITETVERLTQPEKRTADARLDLAADTKKTLELAVDEARRMGHHYIGTEHLLLGLIRGSNKAVDVLKMLNVSPEEIRRQTRRVMQEQPPKIAQPPGKSEQEDKFEAATLVQEAGTMALVRYFQGVLVVAAAEARRLKHDQVGPEHLLVALLIDENDIGGDILRTLGVAADRVQEAVQQLPVSETELPAQLHFSPDLISVLGMAVEEAFLSGNPYLRSEHLLLGLVRQKESKAIDILNKLGVPPEQIAKVVRWRNADH